MRTNAEILYEIREFHFRDSFRVGIFQEEENAKEWAKEKYGDDFYENASNAKGEMEGVFLNEIVKEHNIPSNVN